MYMTKITELRKYQKKIETARVKVNIETKSGSNCGTKYYTSTSQKDFHLSGS